MIRIDPLEYFLKFYPTDSTLRRLLLLHSGQVAQKAMDICDKHPELGADKDLVYAGGMLHDVGVFLTNAPGIYCKGNAPYLLHGVLGAQLFREMAQHEWREDAMERVEWLERIARICERHTGTGLRRNDFERLGLPLPATDLLPERIEEEIVCYADKFFSKSHPERVRSVGQTADSLQKFGEEHVRTFRAWSERFE